MKILNFKMACLYSIGVLVMLSCKGKQECGIQDKRDKNGRFEIYLCDSLLIRDTLTANDLGWVGESGLDEIDSIQFVLPENNKIIDAKQSFIITPSIWADENDEVGQYNTLDDLSRYCISSKKIGILNNLVINSKDPEEHLTIEKLYFASKPDISKNALLESLNNLFAKRSESMKEMTPDEYTSESDISKMIIDNEHEKNIYLKYLKNYISWKNVSNERFELLATTRYLTLFIQNENRVKTVTFVFEPVFGN